MCSSDLEIWLTDSIAYKFVIKDSALNLIGTYDNIVGINSNFVNYTASQEIQTATAGQTVFTLTTMVYQPGTNALSVFVDGVNQYGPGAQYAFTETDSTTVTFADGLHVGASVKFTTAVINNIGGVDASQVTYTPPFTNSVSTNVEAKLSEYVTVEDFGAIGDGTTNDTTKIQNAINALQSGQTLVFDKDYKITGLQISNKSRIRLTGKGRVFLSGASSSAYIFQLIGTIDDLEIDHLTLVGDGNSGYTQCAIGCNSGQTISNTRFHDLNISDINVGISHNANLGGSWDKSVCYNNSLKDIGGTVAGSGYGIHMAKATNVRVYDNVIDNASRHSIYQGSGVNVNNIIHNNLIINHRSTVADASYRCAISCSRSSNVTISNNKFYNCYDGQIEIAHETSSTQDCSNILVIGNTFTNRKNVVPSILVGEQLTPTSNQTFKVTIQDNVFDCSYADASGSDDINVLNGYNIYIEGNKFRRYSYSGSLSVEFIALGENSYLSADNQLYDLVVRNNIASIDSAASAARFCYVCTRLCTGTSAYLVKDNYLTNVGSMFYFAATPTNLNSKFKLTTTVTYAFVIGPQSNATGAFNVTGVKPTSQVTVRPQYTLQVPPQPAYTAWANDNGPNGITISATNPTGSTSTQVSQDFLVFVEDF